MNAKYCLALVLFCFNSSTMELIKQLISPTSIESVKEARKTQNFEQLMRAQRTHILVGMPLENADADTFFEVLPLVANYNETNGWLKQLLFPSYSSQQFHALSTQDLLKAITGVDWKRCAHLFQIWGDDTEDIWHVCFALSLGEVNLAKKIIAKKSIKITDDMTGFTVKHFLKQHILKAAKSCDFTLFEKLLAFLKEYYLIEPIDLHFFQTLEKETILHFVLPFVTPHNLTIRTLENLVSFCAYSSPEDSVFARPYRDRLKSLMESPEGSLLFIAHYPTIMGLVKKKPELTRFFERCIQPIDPSAPGARALATPARLEAAIRHNLPWPYIESLLNAGANEPGRHFHGQLDNKHFVYDALHAGNTALAENLVRAGVHATAPDKINSVTTRYGETDSVVTLALKRNIPGFIQLLVEHWAPVSLEDLQLAITFYRGRKQVALEKPSAESEQATREVFENIALLLTSGSGLVTLAKNYSHLLSWIRYCAGLAEKDDLYDLITKAFVPVATMYIKEESAVYQAVRVTIDELSAQNAQKVLTALFAQVLDTGDKRTIQTCISAGAKIKSNTIIAYASSCIKEPSKTYGYGYKPPIPVSNKLAILELLFSTSAGEQAAQELGKLPNFAEYPAELRSLIEKHMHEKKE